MKRNILRIVRIAVEAVVLAGFSALFAFSGFRLAGAADWLPKIQFWPAVMAANFWIVGLILVLTVLFGRIYCSTVCPLGILQDFVYHIRIHSGPKRNRFKQQLRPANNLVRYLILAAFIGVCCLGIGVFAYLVEPYSIFGRAVSSITETSLLLGAVSLVTLGTIVAITLKFGREWCNTVCPVGSILSIASRKAVFAPRIDESKCVGCGLCGRACRASCIDTKNHKVDTSRCLVCLDCISTCRDGAISYAPLKVHTHARPVDRGRRAFLGTAALLGGQIASDAAPLRRRERPQRETPVVPAGAGSLQRLAQKCIGCQLCVAKCPGNVLRASTDPSRLLLPEMYFEKGWCDDSCTVCSQVCPTGAIQKITDEQKTLLSIGHAVVDPALCFTFTRGAKCGVCVHRCPKGAVRMIDGHPQVSAEQCIGCGMCEFSCPVRPVSAIHVEGLETHTESVFGAFGGEEFES